MYTIFAMFHRGMKKRSYRQFLKMGWKLQGLRVLSKLKTRDGQTVFPVVSSDADTIIVPSGEKAIEFTLFV